MDNKNHNENNKNAGVAKNTAAMSIATLSSRATGLLRTWMMAFALGNTVITSAYQVANNMPNVVFDLVAGGVLGSAFIPIFMLEKQRAGKKGSNDFSCNILNITIIALGLLSILMTIFAPQVIETQTFTVSGQSEVTDFGILFFRIFAIQILFYGVGAVFNGVLNGERIYFLPALAPALNNVVVIISFLGYFIIYEQNHMAAIIILAIGTTAGVLVQCIVQWPAIKRTGFKWKPILNFKDKAFIESLKIGIPTFIYVLGMIIAFSFRNAFSLNIADNGPATILYAWTWFQLPYGVIAVSLARTMFTEMSESYAKKDMKNFKKNVNFGIQTTLLLIIPISMLMFTLSSPIISLFRAGNFNADDVSYVSLVLRAWVMCLPFYSVVMYLYNVYASMRKFTIFAIVSIIAVIGQCTLYWYFCSEMTAFQLIGIPISDFIFYTLCCVVLLIILQIIIGSFKVWRIVWTSIRVSVASFLGVAIGYIITFNIDLGHTSIANGILQLIVCGGISFICILFFCWAFRIKDFLNIMHTIRQKLLRLKSCKK